VAVRRGGGALTWIPKHVRLRLFPSACSLVPPRIDQFAARLGGLVARGGVSAGVEPGAKDKSAKPAIVTQGREAVGGPEPEPEGRRTGGRIELPCTISGGNHAVSQSRQRAHQLRSMRLWSSALAAAAVSS